MTKPGFFPLHFLSQYLYLVKNLIPADLFWEIFQFLLSISQGLLCLLDQLFNMGRVMSILIYLRREVPTVNSLICLNLSSIFDLVLS